MESRGLLWPLPLPPSCVCVEKCTFPCLRCVLSPVGPARGLASRFAARSRSESSCSKPDSARPPDLAISPHLSSPAPGRVPVSPFLSPYLPISPIRVKLRVVQSTPHLSPYPPPYLPISPRIRLARGRRRSSASWPASRAGGGRRRATSRLRRRVVAGGAAADAARQEARRREGFLERTQRPPRRVGLGASRRRRRAGARRRLSAAGAARGSGRCQAPARRGYRAAPSWLHVGRKVLTETVGPAMGRMAMLLGTVVGMAHTCTGRSRCVPGAGRRGVTLSEIGM